MYVAGLEPAPPGNRPGLVGPGLSRLQPHAYVPAPRLTSAAIPFFIKKHIHTFVCYYCIYIYMKKITFSKHKSWKVNKLWYCSVAMADAGQIWSALQSIKWRKIFGSDKFPY